MSDIYTFLAELKDRKIYFELGSYSDDCIMVNVTVPGERWECEFFKDGSVAIEVFKSDGKIYGEELIKTLFEKHSD